MSTDEYAILHGPGRHSTRPTTTLRCTVTVRWPPDNEAEFVYIGRDGQRGDFSRRAAAAIRALAGMFSDRPPFSAELMQLADEIGGDDG